ncbi:MAG: metal ABC transporter substrate-binding protein [Myxococcota bacterium]|nr:metal ABC transporter substrate-binding protein [Myxococcota bacterium]
MIRTSWVLAVLIACAAIGCGQKGGRDSGKPKVAVSIFPLYDLTRRIAGDRLDVMLVLPPGKSEHGYDPTPQEIARLDGAKLSIAVGLDMDAWLESIMKSAKIASVYRIGEKLPTMPIQVEPIGEEEAHDDHEGEKHDEHEHEHEKGAPDPHVWLDPVLMQQGVALIAEQLALIDPAGKDTFTKNASAIKVSLQQLDAKIAERSKAWTKRTIVTFHGSMAYFAKRYNIRIAAVVEPLAGKEPTASYIAEVLGAIKHGKAVALFSEPQLDKGPGEMIAKEAGIKLGELDPVGGLKGRESYEALLTWNTDQLEAHLK